MFQELKFQLSTAILTILTLAACVGAFLSLENQLRTHIPDDGVIWVDRGGHVEALYVTPKGAGANAGVHAGDWITGIEPISTNQADEQPVPVSGLEIHHAIEVAQGLAGIGEYRPAQYNLIRRGIAVPVKVTVGEVPHDRGILYQYALGAGYLLIGLFVYFRRGSAQKAQHFYILCLVSFIFFSAHYTGTLNGFDKGVYYVNVLAGLAAAAIFLHFCVTFPEPLPGFPPLEQGSGAYLPGAFCFRSTWGIDRRDASGCPADRPALVPGPGLDSADDRPVYRGRLRTQHRVSEGGRPCNPAAIEVAAQRNLLWDFAVHPALRLPYAAGAVPNEYLKLSVFRWC